MRGGPRPFEVKMSGDSSEVLREGADDSTLGAAEFDTLKACKNVDHIDKNVGARPWWMQIGTLFGQATCKGIEGSEWHELYHHYRDLR